LHNSYSLAAFGAFAVQVFAVVQRINSFHAGV